MRPVMVGAFSVVTMVMGACSSAPAREAVAPAGPAGSASAVATAPPSAGSEFFYGTSKIYPLPSELPVPSATRHVLVRRTIDPAANRIVEDVVTEGRRGPEEFVVTMTVAGATFTMEERGGAFRGTGTLTGDPWRWTSWTSHSVMPDGATVDSTDTLSGNTLHVEKDYKGPHGSIRLIEDYTRIDRTAYNAHRAALGVAPDTAP